MKFFFRTHINSTKLRPSVFGLLSLFIISSCKRDKGNDPIPPASTTPALELVSVSPSSVHQLSDSITFVIKYTDGDGDLGYESADSMSLYLTDTRFPLTMDYHIQPLSPVGTSISITGNLSVVLHNTILKNSSSTSESAVFEIKMRDRSGHISNTLTCPAITVLP